MLLDLEKLPQGQQFQADVCIAGAGAAGVALARRLAGLGHSVCLLESGGMDFEQATQDLYAGAIAGMTYYDLVDARLRFLGGTTNIWGGRCALLDEIDFRRRPWVPHSGWPISGAELTPYYAAVHDELGLGEVCYDESLWGEIGEPLPPFDPEQIGTRFWRFDDMRERFAARRVRDLADSDSVTLVLHANVTHIQAAANAASVEHLNIASLAGVQGRVVARHYVLACGGIENPRLLLASNDVEAAGIGNGNDQVGRYFMEHPHGRAGRVSGPGAFPLWAAFRKRFRRDGPDLAPVLVPSAAAQEREGILNSAFTLSLQRDPARGVAVTRQLYQTLKHGMAPTRRGRTLWHTYRAMRSTAQRLARVPFERLRAALGMRRLYLMIRAEQAPNPDSRVTLCSERDALGMPRASLSWQLGEQDKRTIQVMVRLLDDELTRLGLGTVEASPWLGETGNAWPVDPTVGNHPIGGYHHIGTTRMSADPRHGVVDGNGRLHGYGNLFLAGSSVFATAGWANPTLTILALALRLGDHLHGLLGGKS